ncbi:MAG: efflux transporter outer membrane subunit [Planctomycetes bacterium]|nr:efflux transporter outer membrane subunit [Planctomycetota bacterium]
MNVLRSSSGWLLALLAACTVGPEYRPPELPEVPAWTAPGDTAIDSAGVAAFWSAFGDPTLEQLLQRALAGNRDLRVAIARLQEARLRAGAAGSELWPRADVTGSYSDSRLSENGFLQGIATGNLGGGGSPGAVFPGQQIDLHQIGFDASWELDLFGGLRRGIEAAEADAAAVQQDLRAARIALCGDVTDAYVELRSLQQRAALADRLLTAHRESVAVLDEQVGAGIADDLDLARARTLLAEQEGRAAEAHGEITATVRRLEILLGVLPGELTTTLGEGRLPAVPDVLAIDVPAATLARRPDVAAAERRLAAATARIGVATAELYPRFSLTGAFGLQAQDIADLPQADSRFWAIGPALRWPLFDFGRVRAAIDQQDARTRQALAAYEGTVIAALGDVEIALVRVARWRRQLAALRTARDSARHAAELADEQFRSGVLEYSDLLDTQRSRDLAEEDCEQGQAALLHAVVTLGKALGVGPGPGGDGTEGTGERGASTP